MPGRRRWRRERVWCCGSRRRRWPMPAKYVDRGEGGDEGLRTEAPKQRETRTSPPSASVVGLDVDDGVLRDSISSHVLSRLKLVEQQHVGDGWVLEARCGPGLSVYRNGKGWLYVTLA